jgi:uncharacterized protein YjbI with pentapeptide repeats
VVRLGGIYELEGVMNTSATYHEPIIEGLSAFIRATGHAGDANGNTLPDVSAAFIVLGRRATRFVDNGLAINEFERASRHRRLMDLSKNLYLVNIRLPPNTFYGWAGLSEANLSNSDMWNADFNHADLVKAKLLGVQGYWIEFGDADLSGADLTDAKLYYAQMDETEIANANLTRTDLSGANLRDVNFENVIVEGTIFTNANLAEADLTQSRGLTQQQIDSSCTDMLTKLPAGIKGHACN